MLYLHQGWCVFCAVIEPIVSLYLPKTLTLLFYSYTIFDLIGCGFVIFHHNNIGSLVLTWLIAFRNIKLRPHGALSLTVALLTETLVKEGDKELVIEKRFVHLCLWFICGLLLCNLLSAAASTRGFFLEERNFILVTSLESNGRRLRQWAFFGRLSALNLVLLPIGVSLWTRLSRVSYFLNLDDWTLTLALNYKLSAMDWLLVCVGDWSNLVR